MPANEPGKRGGCQGNTVFLQSLYLQEMKLKRISQWIIAPIIFLILSVHGISFLRFLRDEYAHATAGSVFFRIKHIGVRILDSLEKWQTLTTGILALCAAFVGVLAVLHQTNVTKKATEKSMRQRADALRFAHLPFMLSGLTQFCKDEAAKIDEIYNKLSEDKFSQEEIKESIKITGVEQFIYPHMIELIETHEGDFKKNLIIFCKRLQLYQARLRTLQEENMVIVRPNMTQLAVDLSEIKARIDKFFPLARLNDQESIEEISCDVRADNVQSAALSIFWTTPIDNLEASIEARATHGEMDSPWPET